MWFKCVRTILNIAEAVPSTQRFQFCNSRGRVGFRFDALLDGFECLVQVKAPVVCGVASLGYDHTELLGRSSHT
jgi:hypothetical protein